MLPETVADVPQVELLMVTLQKETVTFPPDTVTYACETSEVPIVQNALLVVIPTHACVASRGNWYELYNG